MEHLPIKASNQLYSLSVYRQRKLEEGLLFSGQFTEALPNLTVISCNYQYSLCVYRQRKLEEGLLFSGQFTEALQALLDWLAKVEPTLGEDNMVHGDIDTVNNLVEEHKVGSTRGYSSYCTLN